jgi:hypothetical protein
VARLLVAQIGRKYANYNLGRWLTEREVAVARDRAALHFDGENAVLALPQESRRLGPATPEELRRLARATWKAAVTTSRYRGVVRDDDRGRWIAKIKIHSKESQIGRFKSERAAAIAYDQAALFHLGKDATLNFPERRNAPRSVEAIRRAHAVETKKKDKNPHRGVAEKGDDRRLFGYQAHLQQRKRRLSLGAWRTAREAAIAHDRAALFYHRDRAWLNFPELQRSLNPANAEELQKESHRIFKAQTSSRFRGVLLDQQKGLWRAHIYRKGRWHHLGFFDSEEEAAHAYDRKAPRLHGKKAKLNFDPVTGEELLWRGAPTDTRSSRPRPAR